MRLNWKESVGYLIYTVGFAILLITIGNISYQFINIAGTTFRFFPWHIYAILLYIPVGIYLGLPKLIKEAKKSGQWKLNLHKLLFVALPMTFFAFYLYIFGLAPFPALLAHAHTMLKLGTLVAGYMLIASLTKGEYI